MSTITRITLILFAGLTLPLCSCQSGGGMPQDPFAPGLPRIEREDSTNETPKKKNSTSPFTIGGSATMSVRGQAPSSNTANSNAVISNPAGIVRPVEYVQVNDVQAEKPPVKINRIIVDPTLSQRGAEIVARQREGAEVFLGPWRPHDGLGFWPQAEYLADGGDHGASVTIEEDWSVHHLGREDTVAHFDTLDGRILVEPSNRVHLYAPRFGSVRKVEGIINNHQITALSETNNRLALNVDQNREQLGFTAQEAKTGYARTRNQLGGVAVRHASSGAAGTQNLGQFGGFESVMLYSNWLRQQAVGAAELVYLAEGGVSARAWQGQEGIKIQMNSLAPMAATAEEGAESFFQIDEKTKTSKLRLIKVADKKAAQPGDRVEFTLRFDNVGNQPIGNVTILDNLTTRLEFLPGTAQSSLASGFVVQPNDVGSFTLRFEITEPLLPGQFGVVQFQCRVR